MAKDRRRYLSWDDLIAAERHFFQGNALLRGLKPERWGLPSLKVCVSVYKCILYMCILGREGCFGFGMGWDTSSHRLIISGLINRPHPQRLVVEFQINAISQRIPDMTVKVRRITLI